MVKKLLHSRLPILKKKPSWNTRAYTYNKYLRIAISIITVNLSIVITLVLHPYIGDIPVFLFFLNTVIISAWFGGFLSGSLATVFSLLSITYFYSSGLFPGGTGSRFIFRSAIFFIDGMLLSFFIQHMHHALRSLSDVNNKLKRSEARYRLVVETVRDYSIYTLNPSGYITSWNKGAEKIKDYTSEEIIGKHFSIFFSPDDIQSGHPWKALKRALHEGTYAEERYHVTKNGTYIWTSSVITPIYDGGGKSFGFSVISRDMTEHKEYEKRKDEFISIASHELKTPVTSLKVFTQLLLKVCSTTYDKTPIKYLHKMDMQLDRLTMLVNDLLDVSKIQAGKIELRKESFNFNELVKDTVDQVQAMSGKHRFVIKGMVRDSTVGDKDRIYQVLINFLTNAVKYSPESDIVEVLLSQDSDSVYVSVKDYGIGIPHEYRDKIFDRFFRINHSNGNSFPGLGMGLFISSEIIRRHNGNIWVESENGKGSTFSFSVPIHPQI